MRTRTNTNRATVLAASLSKRTFPDARSRAGTIGAALPRGHHAVTATFLVGRTGATAWVLTVTAPRCARLTRRSGAVTAARQPCTTSTTSTTPVKTMFKREKSFYEMISHCFHL